MSAPDFRSKLRAANLFYCSDCKSTLPVDCFAKNKSAKHGVQNICRKCMAARSRSPERVLWRQQWLERRKEQQAV